MEQLQSHASYMGKYLRISSYIRKRGKVYLNFYFISAQLPRDDICIPSHFYLFYVFRVSRLFLPRDSLGLDTQLATDSWDRRPASHCTQKIFQPIKKRRHSFKCTVGYQEHTETEVMNS
jgi:hypothetical protein